MNWTMVDENLRKYLKTYNKKQELLKQDLQNIFNIEIDDIYSIVSKSDLKQFKRYLENNKELIKNNDYVSYMYSKYINKARITYKQLLEVMILVAYAVFQEKISKNQLDTLQNIGSKVYSESIEQCEKLGLKRKHSILPIGLLVTAILLKNNNLGLSYQEQNDANTIRNAQEVYKMVILDLTQKNKPNIEQKKYIEVLDKQKRREINYKTTTAEDKFSGYLDNQNTFVVNQMKLDIYKAYGVKKVILIAEIDDKTTTMCKTLDRQTFFIDEWNTYSRYSKEDNKNVVYKTFGLVMGDNLPPITNSFHWCRSYIEPLKEV